MNILYFKRKNIYFFKRSKNLVVPVGKLLLLLLLCFLWKMKVGNTKTKFG